MKNILVINGPNLNLLGKREPEIYGSESLEQINASLQEFSLKANMEVKFFQSNHEGHLIDFIHQERGWANGIVINPGALSHYSYALRDAIEAVGLPAIEVHLSDITSREEFRKKSVTAEVCEKLITGYRSSGYFRAIEYLAGLGVLKALNEKLTTNNNRDKILKYAVELLKKGFPKYTWVGIYLLQGGELVVHNYIGKPTPHEVIPVGKGICGAAVQEGKSIIVSDVNADPRYLACTLETRSEIVVPIRSPEQIYGEIDIDSDLADSFHDGDKEILEKCADILAGLFQAESANITD